MRLSLSFIREAAVFVVCTAILVSVPVHAQQASANISGVVYDVTDAAVAEASVKLVNVDTGVVQTTTTNRSGTYVLLNVTPGVYTVKVEKTGFSTVEQSQVKLDVNQTATFDFRLKVGSTQETVEVRADAAGVESSTSELGTVIGSKEVVDLPLNGRNFTQLLTLTPGAAPVQNFDQTGSGGGGFAGNALGQFSFPAINGQRVRSNVFLLDGVNNQNTFLSTNNYTPIVDAIGEFKVQTHNDDSQYGGVVGGIINVVSRSGTNHYHGTVWEFLRNEKMDADGYFSKFDAANVRPRDPLRQNVFGAGLGGPVSIPKLYNGKDRTFFFAAYEGYRFRGKNQLTQRAATPAMRAGDFGVLCTEGFVAGLCLNRDHQLYDPFSTVADPANPGSNIRSPFLNNKITRPLDPTALAYQAIFPQGVQDANDPFYTVNAPGGKKDDQDEGQIRVDQTIGSHDQIYGRFAKYYQLITQAQTVIQTHLAPLYGYNWTVHETHTFGPNAILDGYVARNYGNNEQTLTLASEPALITAIQQTGVSPAFLDVGGQTRAPAIGFNNGNYTSLGFNQSQATGLADVWEYGATFTKVLGRHIVKVGGAITTNGFFSPIRGSHETFDAQQTAGVGLNVGHGGDSYASFLLGAPTNAGNRIVDERVHGGYSDNAYIHEQWKVNKNLTINVGARYDLKLWPIYGPKGLTADSYSGEPNPVTGEYILTYLPPNCSATQGAPCIPNGQYVSNGGQPTPYSGLPPHVVVAKNGSILNNDYGDIGFRAGMAYRVNEHLAIRAGYGRFFDTWGAAAQDSQNFNGNWPATSLELNGLNPVTVTDPITNPLHLGSAGAGLVYPSVDPYTAGTWSVDPNYKTPYSDQYNFGLQQELPGQILLDMNYVGSISRRLDVTDVLNVDSTPGPGTKAEVIAREPFPYLGNAWFQQSIGNANFNALEVSLNKRATRNLAFLVSYTWSKSIDDGCSGDIGAACSIQNVYDRSGDRSVSGFDLPHVFSGSFTATSPYGKGRNLDNRFANALVGGWAVNGIVTLHSGGPYDVGASASIPNICFCANTERSSVIGDPRATGAKNINTTWFNTANVVVPAPFTFGTMKRNSLRSDRWRNTDLSFFRQFNVGLGESRYFEFRAEAFNVFNNVVFGIPNRDRGDASTFGRVRGVANSPRQLQVALKIVF